MANQKKSTESTDSSSKTQKPYSVYTVRDSNNGGEGFWVRIGAAFPNRDGKGFNVVLDALPLDGRLVIREPKADE